MFFSGWMVKTAVLPYHRILLCNKNEYMQPLWWSTKELCWVKKDNLKRLHTVWFHLYYLLIHITTLWNSRELCWAGKKQTNKKSQSFFTRLSGRKPKLLLTGIWAAHEAEWKIMILRVSQQTSNRITLHCNSQSTSSTYVLRASKAAFSSLTLK